MASNLQNITVSVKCDFDNEGFDRAISKVKQFRKTLKMSLWEIIKLKLLNIYLPRTKVTIQNLIDRDTELNRSKK